MNAENQPCVLVVHDDPEVRGAFRKVLDAAGWKVAISERSAPTAAELLEAGQRVDVMLVPMEDLEGEHMTRVGVGRAGGREVPVLAVDIADLADVSEQLQALIPQSPMN